MYRTTHGMKRVQARAVQLIFGVVFSGFCFCACVSKPSRTYGVQPEYTALNPSRILAVTPLVVGIPGDKNATIDPVVLQIVPLVEFIEKEVLQDFSGQPAVNGVSFKAVRKSLERVQPKNNPIEMLTKSLGKTIDTLQLSQREREGMVSTECRRRKTFIDFYEHCLKDQDRWRKGLNNLAMQVLNADAALLLFVTNLAKNTKSGRATVTINALLVDTNNASLIWAGTQTARRKEEVSQGPQQLWSELVQEMLDEKLWMGFPGRTVEQKTSTEEQT